MAAVRARVRAELRRRWRATVLLTLLVGLVGGVVMTAVAGARRTDSAMGRFLAATRPLNVALEPAGLDLRAVQRLPQVADAEIAGYLAMAPSTAAGAPDPAALGSISPLIGLRGRFGVSSERLRLVAGRPPRPDRPLEVAVNETVATRWRVRPGGTLRMWAYTPAQVAQPLQTLEGARPVAPRGPALDFTVTAVVRQPQDIVPISVDQDVVYLGRGTVFLTPAFWPAYGARVGTIGAAEPAFRLRRGRSDVDAFRAAVRRLPGGRQAVFQVDSDAEVAAATAQRAIHVQAVALLAFAALSAVAGLLIVGQGIVRQVQLDAADRPTLAALGMTPGQLMATALVRAGLIGAGGAVLAVALAVLASPLTPIGLARQAEIEPGWSIDARVLALGALGVLLAVLARAGAAAWWLAVAGRARESAAQRPSQPAERLARAGAPPTAVVGVRLALAPGRADNAVPVRTALVGAVVAVAAVAASLTFAASLDRLVGSPVLQGWNWDVVVGNYHDQQDISPRAERLARNPLVAGYSAVGPSPEQLRIGGIDVPAVGVQTVKGTVGPRVVQGHAARSADEIELGRATLRRLGLAVGDLVEVRGSRGPRRMRVVGEVLVPSYYPDTAISRGAVVTMDGLRALLPGAFPNQYLVEYAPGADRAAAFASLRRDFGRTVLQPLRPDEVETFSRVRGLPFALAALLAVLGATTVGHLLVTSVRRRRRDLAVLKTMGFVRRQVSATVAWQASTVAALALSVGLPLGVAAGRWAWILVDQTVGSPAGPVTPLVPLVLAVPAVLLIANLVAAVPARVAAATQPAVVLRSE